MKRTLTINISGIVFNIDEDAYEKLKIYLIKVSSHFNKETGGHEIIFDIESRIAELFSEKISEGQNVINESMVNEVISIMGLPEEIDDEDSEKGSKNEFTSQYQGSYFKKSKKLYRDPDSRVIGGVCSGLAYYFNIDKVLMRIIFFIVFLITSGIALPAYIILWIAVPKARTTSQRLEMKGEPINVENIGRSVKEEMSDKNPDNNSSVKDSKSNKSNFRTTQPTRNYENNSPSVFGKIIGIILVFIGFISFAGLIISLFATSKMIGIFPGFFPEIGSSSFVTHFFTNSTISTLIISLLIIVGIPILLFIYAGTKLIFNYNSNNRSVILSSLGIWVLGIIIAITSIVGAVNVFSTTSSLDNTKGIFIPSDTIIISVEDMYLNTLSESKYEVNNLKVININGKEVLASSPRLKIEKSGSSSIEIFTKKSSKGNNYNSAQKNAENISYSFKIEGSKIIFDPYFTIAKNDKWRSQKCNISLKIPDGKVVFIDESMLPLINDIDNTSGTWVGDMVNNYWIMKSEGLTLCAK